MTFKAKILSAIHAGHDTTYSIACAIGCQQPSISTYLANMQKKGGEVTVVGSIPGRGRGGRKQNIYALTDVGLAQVEPAIETPIDPSVFAQWDAIADPSLPLTCGLELQARAA